MLSRVKLGYAPSTIRAPVFLVQDIDDLNARFLAGQTPAAALLADSAEIEAEARRLQMPEMIARILLQRGRILSAGGRYREALDNLTKADEALGDRRQHDLKVSILAAQADAHSGRHAWKSAMQICTKGIALVEHYRHRVNAQYLQGSYLRSRIGLYAQGVRAAYVLEDHDRMIEWAELSKCRSVLRQRDTDASAGDDERHIEEQFLRVCGQIDDARKTDRTAMLPTLLAKRRTLWDLLLIQRNAKRSGSLPLFDSVSLKAALAADEAVLYYYWLDKRALLVVAMDNRRIVPTLCTLSDDERQGLIDYARIVLEALSPALPGYLRHADKARRFAALLLPEAAHDVIGDKRRVLISPHRLLHALPFQVLPWDETHPYLIQRFAVTYIPNLSSLLIRYQSPARRSLLTVGISDYARHDAPYPRLEEAAQEAAELETLYAGHGVDVRTLLDAQADEKQLNDLDRTDALAQFSCLHMSTHGHNVNSDTPMESSLVLYDSLLDGLDIANWRLNAELTVLSACCSGQRPYGGRRMDELPGDDLFGLQAAFFAAGAKRVIRSLWPVDAGTAHRLVMAFHRHYASGQSPELALQKAIIDHIAHARPRLRKSYYWAAFFLSAVGRPEGGKHD